MSEHKVLIISGDFDVVQRIRLALEGQPINIFSAYSHLDAVYALRYDAPILAIVDGRLLDQRTGMPTIDYIRQSGIHETIPTFVCNAPERLAEEFSRLDDLSRSAILTTVGEALTLPIQTEEMPTEPLNNRVIPGSLWREEEMRTLFELSRSLTEVLNVNEVLTRVVTAARRLTNAQEGLILMPGSDDALYLQATAGVATDEQIPFRVKTDDTLAGNVFRTGIPVKLNDAGLQKVKTEYFVKALIYVPIRNKDRIVGVLGVSNRDTSGSFTNRHLELLSILAAYAAIAIDNAHAHEQVIQRTHDLQLLIAASSSINEALASETALTVISEQFLTLLSGQLVNIHLLDAACDQLYLLARVERARPLANQSRLWYPKQWASLDQAIRAGRTIFLRADTGKPAPSLMSVYYCNAALMIPLITDNQLIGVLSFYWRNDRSAPDDQQLDLLRRELRANAFVLITDNESAYRQAERLLRDWKRSLGADRIEFSAAAGFEAFDCRFAIGDIQSTLTDTSLAIYPLSADESVQAAVESQKVVVKTRLLDHESPFSAKPVSQPITAHTLILPLIVRGVTRGVVIVVDPASTTPFDERVIDMGRAFAVQTAIALDNSSLLADLQRSLNELHKTQEKLVKTARFSTLAALAGALAHQVNNPLTTVILNTQLLLSGDGIDAHQQEMLEAIVRAGKRASSVVKRLLFSANPNARTLTPEPINVGYTIDETVSLLRSQHRTDRAVLYNEASAADGCFVMALPSELEDVWLNLLTNARDAVQSQEKPQYGISARIDRDTKTLEVVVWDNGVGIDPSMLTAVFEPFVTTKAEGEGTGLGLFICRQIVEQVSGSLTIESQIGSGTRVIVHLPIISVDDSHFSQVARYIRDDNEQNSRC